MIDAYLELQFVLGSGFALAGGSEFGLRIWNTYRSFRGGFSAALELIPNIECNI